MKKKGWSFKLGINGFPIRLIYTFNVKHFFFLLSSSSTSQFLSHLIETQDRNTYNICCSVFIYSYLAFPFLASVSYLIFINIFSQNFIFYSNLYSIVLDYQIYFMNITNICICIACITSLIIKKKIGPGTNFAQVWAPAAPTWDIQSTYILCPYPFPHSSYLASNFSVCLISSCVGSAHFFFCCLPLFLYWVTAFSPRSLEFIYNIMNKAVN